MELSNSWKICVQGNQASLTRRKPTPPKATSRPRTKLRLERSCPRWTGCCCATIQRKCTARALASPGAMAAISSSGRVRPRRWLPRRAADRLRLDKALARRRQSWRPRRDGMPEAVTLQRNRLLDALRARVRARRRIAPHLTCGKSELGRGAYIPPPGFCGPARGDEAA